MPTEEGRAHSKVATHEHICRDCRRKIKVGRPPLDQSYSYKVCDACWSDDQPHVNVHVHVVVAKRYTERSLRFIEASRQRSFFLYLAHAMPHKPLAASEDFYQKTGTGLYGDTVSEVDWSVGQILQKLEALDLDRRPLVIFLSDNGPWYGGSTGGATRNGRNGLGGGYPHSHDRSLAGEDPQRTDS